MVPKNWWPLAACGVLNAIISVIYWNHAAQGFHASRDMVLLGELTTAAGVCAIVAGVWNWRSGRSWLLALNGFALGALGLFLGGEFGFRISFRTIALLIILMAVSVGAFELVTARREWLLCAAGVASIGFALAFLGLAFGWIRIEAGPAQTLHWLGAYFAFSALSMLGLAQQRIRTSL